MDGGTIFRFPVEPGRIFSFARSIADMRPVYAAQLGSAPGAVLTVPPTFAVSANHFDPSTTVAISPGAHSTSGGRADTVHAEQVLEFFHPLRVGDALSVSRRQGKSWSVRGRSGQLDFQEYTTEFRTDAGVLAVRARKVSVRRSGMPALRETKVGEPREAGPAVAPSKRGSIEKLLVDKLTRAHIAQYAGASGDYNLVHVDEEYATGTAGYPSVIAHGMLTMGLTATFVSSLFETGGLRRFHGRFLLPVLPGDSLSCSVSLERSRNERLPARVHCETCRDTDNAPVFRGTASGVLLESAAATLRGK